MFNWNGSALGTIVSPITGYFEKRNDNKTQIKLSQIERLKNSDNATATLDQIIAENAGSGWKDEFVTVIITLPIPSLFLGVAYSAYTGDPALANAVKEGVLALKELIPEYGQLTLAVFMAAVGLRVIKK